MQTAHIPPNAPFGSCRSAEIAVPCQDETTRSASHQDAGPGSCLAFLVCDRVLGAPHLRFMLGTWNTYPCVCEHFVGLRHQSVSHRVVSWLRLMSKPRSEQSIERGANMGMPGLSLTRGLGRGDAVLAPRYLNACEDRLQTWRSGEGDKWPMLLDQDSRCRCQIKPAVNLVNGTLSFDADAGPCAATARPGSLTAGTAGSRESGPWDVVV